MAADMLPSSTIWLVDNHKPDTRSAGPETVGS